MGQLPGSSVSGPMGMDSRVDSEEDTGDSGRCTGRSLKRGPGGLPEGVSMETLLVTAPHPRNPKLADAFKRAGYVERTARGIDTIFFEQLRNGRAVPSYERTTSSDVVLVFSSGVPDLLFVRMVTEEGFAGRPLELDDLLILRAWWDNGALSLEDVARIVQKSPREVQEKMDELRRRNLQSKRVELSSIGISDAFGTGTLTVLPPSRITHEARRALEEQILVFVERIRSDFPGGSSEFL